ncbi:MAG TPA: GNAT family N-acetyltransferase [Gaiellaceae bacterium]|nr:GNAT family N-acetyltransferase [Gaiellaceae bacterium]
MADIRDARPTDLPWVFELLAARDRAATGTAEVKYDDLAQGWESKSTDRYVTDDGGYGALNASGELVVAGSHPDALLARIERRARERGLPLLTAVVVDGDTPSGELVRRAGYVQRGEVLRMWRQLDGALPDPAWPDGVRVRTYRPEDAARLHALLDEAYGAWDDTYVARPLDVWLADMTSHDDFDPKLWFLAERDGTLAGCALHWAVDRGDGWLKDLVVRAGARGTGLGTALVQHGLREYADRGAARVGLKVDSTNPTGAVQLYERTGFEIERRYAIWLKQL